MVPDKTWQVPPSTNSQRRNLPVAQQTHKNPTCYGEAATIVSDAASIRGTSGPDVIAIENKPGAGAKIVGLGSPTD